MNTQPRAIAVRSWTHLGYTGFGYAGNRPVVRCWAPTYKLACRRALHQYTRITSTKERAR